MKPNRSRPSLWPRILVLLIGIITTVFYYRVGIYDQIEQLPIILRFMVGDDYLANDFFTHAGVQFGPRFYYAHLMAWSGKLVGLGNALFGWMLLAQMGVAWVSFQLGKGWYDGDEVAGLVAAAAAMSAEAVAWGANEVMYGPCLTPGSLVLPLIGLSLLAGSRGRLVQASLWAGLAAGMHILLGLETGFLVLAAGGVAAMNQQGTRPQPVWLQAGLGTGILIMLGLPTLLPYAQQARGLDADTFYQIIAEFRHPHHYLPSHFLANAWAWIKGLAFWGAMALAGRLWHQQHPHQRQAQRFVALLAIFIALGCLVGWLGVEVIPNRLVITAQTWRLLNLLKWLGLVLIGGQLGKLLSGQTPWDGVGGFLSMLTPLSMLAMMGKAAGLRISLLAAALLGLFTAGPLLWIDQLYVSTAGLVAVYALIVGLYLGGKRGWSMAGAGTLILGAGLNATLLAGQMPAPLELIAARVFRPHVYTWTYPAEMQAVMDFARTQTAKSALWLTPPDFGPMRIVGRRAIVVDYKAFPFQDEAILTWYERVLACYGPDPQALHKVWGQWNPATLRRLGKQYQFDYAVVPNTAAWKAQQGVYQTPRYKVLRRAEVIPRP